MPVDMKEIESKLWGVADQLLANTELKPAEYSNAVLGLIFLRYADFKFTVAEEELKNQEKSSRRTGVTKEHYQAKGVLYIPEKARYKTLLNLPEGESVGKAVNEAMKEIEAENDQLKDVLPKNYLRFDNDVLIALMKVFSEIEMDIEGDVFGKVYEYFLGKFANKEGQRGGEFFTPTSLVKLIVEVIEPYNGKILDAACGSGGMFVQSAEFIKRHKKNPNSELSIYGQEKTADTVRLCKMNLAVHGLEGDVKQANTYYENVHNCIGNFDYVMANPPFNVNGIDKSKLADDKRYVFGLPKADNGNYLWIQEFYSAINEKGRAGFVMANSACDARQTEQDIRQKIIEDRVVDVMISIGSNFFHNVTLPCTLWFFDKGKKNTDRKDKVLFIDARDIFTQVDRAHREFTPEQIEFIANIVRLYRDEEPEFDKGSENLLKEVFPDSKYQDIAGRCKVATIKDIEAQGWSLNPGRYVGVCEKCDDEDFNFAEKLEELNEELEMLNSEAKELEEHISDNVSLLLGVK